MYSCVHKTAAQDHGVQGQPGQLRETSSKAKQSLDGCQSVFQSARDSNIILAPILGVAYTLSSSKKHSETLKQFHSKCLRRPGGSAL